MVTSGDGVTNRADGGSAVMECSTSSSGCWLHGCVHFVKAYGAVGL